MTHFMSVDILGIWDYICIDHSVLSRWCGQYHIVTFTLPDFIPGSHFRPGSQGKLKKFHLAVKWNPWLPGWQVSVLAPALLWLFQGVCGHFCNLLLLLLASCLPPTINVIRGLGSQKSSFLTAWLCACSKSSCLKFATHRLSEVWLLQN